MTEKVKGKKGFTLIELLIVVVIIGILAAIAIPRFGETRERAYMSAMQSDINQVINEQEMWYQDNGFEYADDFSTNLHPEGEDGYSEGVTITISAEGDDNQSFTVHTVHDATDRECGYYSDDDATPPNVEGVGTEYDPGVITCTGGGT